MSQEQDLEHKLKWFIHIFQYREKNMESLKIQDKTTKRHLVSTPLERINLYCTYVRTRFGWFFQVF